MGSLLLFLAGILPATPPEIARPIPLRLEAGEEFLYHSVYTQESDRPGTRVTRLLDTYVLILETSPKGTQAAIMTEMRVDGKPGAEAVPVVRLELARIDPFGRVTLESTSTLPHVPIDGPPTLDVLPFIELPAALPDPGRPWNSADNDGGMIAWRMLVAEKYGDYRCIKLKGEQSSGDWNLAGRTVWKRNQTAWMSLAYGFVVHLERATDWRTESGELWKSSLVADLTSMPLTNTMEEFKERRHEILESIRFAKELAELMKPRGEPDFRGYDNLLQRIDRYISRSTPYAAAIQCLRRKTEQARNGERPPEPLVVRTGMDPAKPIEDGETAPDFVASNFAGGAALKINQLRGRPVVLVFFKPSSRLATPVLKYVQATMSPYGGRVHVIAMAVENDSTAIAKLRSELKLQFPIYDGQAALAMFAGHSTPRTIVLDKTGTVDLILHGWNGEFPELIHKELIKLVE